MYFPTEYLFLHTHMPYFYIFQAKESGGEACGTNATYSKHPVDIIMTLLSCELTYS